MQIEKYGRMVVYTMACFALGCMLNSGKSKIYEQQYQRNFENINNTFTEPSEIEKEITYSNNYEQTEKINKNNPNIEESELEKTFEIFRKEAIDACDQTIDALKRLLELYDKYDLKELEKKDK